MCLKKSHVLSDYKHSPNKEKEVNPLNKPQVALQPDGNHVLNIDTAVILVESIVSDEPDNVRAREYLAFLRQYQINENRSKIKIAESKE
jgi:hypothetical protein